MRIENETFVDRSVGLDGNEYVRCHFKGSCTLIYRGGEVPDLVDCELDPGVQIGLADAASRTFEFLSYIGSHGGADLVAPILGRLMDDTGLTAAIRASVANAVRRKDQ